MLFKIQKAKATAVSTITSMNTAQWHDLVQ